MVKEFTLREETKVVIIRYYDSNVNWKMKYFLQLYKGSFETDDNRLSFIVYKSSQCGWERGKQRKDQTT